MDAGPSRRLVSSPAIAPHFRFVVIDAASHPPTASHATGAQGRAESPHPDESRHEANRVVRSARQPLVRR